MLSGRGDSQDLSPRGRMMAKQLLAGGLFGDRDAISLVGGILEMRPPDNHLCFCEPQPTCLTKEKESNSEQQRPDCQQQSLSLERLTVLNISCFRFMMN